MMGVRNSISRFVRFGAPGGCAPLLTWSLGSASSPPGCLQHLRPHPRALSYATQQSPPPHFVGQNSPILLSIVCAPARLRSSIGSVRLLPSTVHADAWQYIDDVITIYRASSSTPKTANAGEEEDKDKDKSMWTATEMRHDAAAWTYILTEQQKVGLLEAAHALKGRGVALEDITPSQAMHYTPASLAADLADVKQALAKGRGFALFKGVPVQGGGESTTWDALCMYLLLGLQAHDPALRIYRTPQAQRFHTDSADVVGLLCLTNEAEGGVSSIASSVSVYNRMQQDYPDHLAVLEGDLVWDRKGEVPPGKLPFYNGPVFNRCDDKILTIYDRKFFETASRHDGVEALTPREVEALDIFEGLAGSNELRLDMELEPGDVQFIHNHQILHARSAFRDALPGRRHLIRLWLSLNKDDGWLLPEAFGEGRYANIDRNQGSVGGISAEDGKPPNYPLTPE